MDKINLDKIQKEMKALRSDVHLDFKLDHEMMSFLIINGFFFTVLLFIQLIWFSIVNYTSFAGFWALASAVGFFYLYLRPTSDESQSVQGYFNNFNSSVFYRPKNIHRPTSVSEVAEIIKDAANNGRKVRVYGGGSSFNAIGQTDSDVILLEKFNSINVDKKTAIVGAGVKVGELAVALWEQGLSLPNLGWFDAQSVGSAIQTTTHANSLKYGTLATRVVALELVNGSGEVVHVTSENQDVFNSALGGLGLLGVITSVTFECETLTNVKKTTSVVAVEEVDLNARANSNEYYTVWWIPHVNKANQIIVNKTNERTAAEKTTTTANNVVQKYQAVAVKVAHSVLFNIYYQVLFNVSAAVELANTYSLNFYTKSLKPQDEVVRSYEALLDADVLPHWSEAEYFVPVEKAQAVFKELQQTIKSGGWVVNFPARIGFVKQDEFYLSEAYHMDAVTFSVAMFNKSDKWGSFIARIDKLMKANGARPHWAKSHSYTKQELEQLYPRWSDFAQVRSRFDPSGVFLNEYLAKFFA